MSEIIFLNLLIFGGILFQGILGSFLENNHKNSSNLHLRTKRMIGHTFLGRGDWMINDVIHIVQIFKGTTKVATGVIVTPEHILTFAACVHEPPTTYTIKSGAPGRGLIINHQIISVMPFESLCLLLIDPRIPEESRFSRPIQPAEEALPVGIHPTTIAWDATGQVRPILQVQILQITENNVSTLPSHEEHNRLFNRDRGSALVVGDRLFAVLGRDGYPYDIPDIFIRVNNNNRYYRWLMEYIQPYLHSHPHLYNPAR